MLRRVAIRRVQQDIQIDDLHGRLAHGQLANDFLVIETRRQLERLVELCSGRKPQFLDTCLWNPEIGGQEDSNRSTPSRRASFAIALNGRRLLRASRFRLFIKLWAIVRQMVRGHGDILASSTGE